MSAAISLTSKGGTRTIVQREHLECGQPQAQGGAGGPPRAGWELIKNVRGKKRTQKGKERKSR